MNDRVRRALDQEQHFRNITAAAAANRMRTTITAEDSGIDIALVEWPTAPGYGYDHAKNTSQLAVHIGGALNLKDAELKVLRTAAFLHDIGRRAPWTESDPSHAQRSAELADSIMRRSPWWSASALREQVCKLIVAHDLNNGRKPTDPLAIALHDAECFEACRRMHDGTAGADLMATRRKACISEWALDDGYHRRWRAKYLS